MIMSVTQSARKVSFSYNSSMFYGSPLSLKFSHLHQISKYLLIKGFSRLKLFTVSPATSQSRVEKAFSGAAGGHLGDTRHKGQLCYDHKTQNSANTAPGTD